MSTALSTAAKLKPEIRLAQALSEFCACLGESRAREFKSLRTKSPPTPQDVIALTEEINRDGSRNHKAWMPYATKMAMFLDKIQTLSRLGDFMVASSQNLMASGIWTTIKITLGIAVGSLSFFKKVSELFLRIGRSSSVTKELSEVFPSSKQLQDLMCEYLIVLVTFCKDIVLVLKKPTLLQLTSPFIAFFDKEASKFETDLGQIALAIDRKVVVLSSQAQAESASTLGRMSKTLAEWSERSDSKKKRDPILRSARIQENLSARSHQLQRVATWRRYRKKGHVRWIFEDEDYRKWCNFTGWVSDQRLLPLLVHGKLGSGKTVLLANIVAELFRLKSQQPAFDNMIIAYYFCSHDQQEPDTPEKIVESILQQHISQLSPERVSSALCEELANSTTLTTEEKTEIVGELLSDSQPVFVVIDGLDKYDNALIERVFKLLSFCSIVRERNRSSRLPIFAHISVCFSFRTGSSLPDILQQVYKRYDPSEIFNMFSISMAVPPSTAEMKAFVDAEFERRRHIRTLDKDLEDIIKDVLVGASEGMYLWVALQIEALFPLHGTTLLSDSDILQLLESPPKDLAEAFKNALNRILDTRYGNKIFQLIASAKRLLTLAELKVALHVKPGETDWSSITPSMPQNERAIVGLCGGGLLEVDEEDDCVRFIHHSVAQYLQDPKCRSNPYCFANYEADIHMGLVCTSYLNYSIFDNSISTVDKTVIKSDQLTSNVAGVISSGSSGTKADVASKLIASITRRRSSKPGAQGPEINIGQILQRYIKPKVESTELMAFSDYAHEHWIWHCNRLWIHSKDQAYKPFKRLLTSTPNHITLPWKLPGIHAITDQYRIIPSGHSRPYSKFSVPSPSREEYYYTWLRWVLAQRHFGILYEYMTTLPNFGDGPSVRRQTLIQDVFYKVIYDTDWDTENYQHPAAVLKLEPLPMFAVMFKEASRYVKSYYPHASDEIVQELQIIVTLDGQMLADLVESDKATW